MFCTQKGKSNYLQGLSFFLTMYWQFWVPQRVDDPGSERGAGREGKVLSSWSGIPLLSHNPRECFSALQEAGEHVPSDWSDNCVTKGVIPAF